ncbi:hypothetical protein [Peredibacter starrii]|uniref:Uncharacterized protein n=1 Tax=Peredibacter starrii TaxID=28202 RepID=A0AAX4HMD5_9BACT|nr:hypothetical protein [Peredibacter starrii]WPU64350.1 hypothetical protein SOO65_16770 [Peredibacter starrii]
MSKSLLLIAMILGLSLSAFAQEAKTEKKEEKTETTPAAKPGKVDEADQVITNRRLRASSGSLSKWSGNFAINYQGGSVEKPGAAQRPNITSGADALTLQYLTANVGLRYRFNPLNSLTLGTGVFMNTPFNSSIKTNDPALKKEFNKTKQDVTVSDPNLIYTNLARVWGFQVVTQLTPTLITNTQQRQAGYRASYDIASTWMRDIGDFGLSGGATFEWTGYSFDKTNQGLAKNVWQLYPVLEYVINDTFNLRTLWGWQVYQQTREMAWDTYEKRVVYQSFGVGISLSRDIFLYPNIQFIPSDIRDDRTNLGISAYINTF